MVKVSMSHLVDKCQNSVLVTNILSATYIWETLKGFLIFHHNEKNIQDEIQNTVLVFVVSVFSFVCLPVAHTFNLYKLYQGSLFSLLL